MCADSLHRDVLACGTSLLPVPHLETIARGPSQNNDNNNSNGDGIGGGAAYARESSQLLALALALAVQSEHKEHFIAPIQRLSQVHQAQLMISIEQVRFFFCQAHGFLASERADVRRRRRRRRRHRPWR